MIHIFWDIWWRKNSWQFISTELLLTPFQFSHITATGVFITASYRPTLFILSLLMSFQSYCLALNNWMISEEWIGKDMEGNGHSPIQYLITEFACRDWRKPQNLKIASLLAENWILAFQIWDRSDCSTWFGPYSNFTKLFICSQTWYQHWSSSQSFSPH